MTAFVTAWISQNIGFITLHGLCVRCFSVNAKTQTTTEQTDSKTVATTVDLNHAVVLVWILPSFPSRGFLISAFPLTEVE